MIYLAEIKDIQLQRI